MNHEEPDRIPIDLGGTGVSSICNRAYVDLMNADVSVKAMKAGKNVLCEKPMAMTLEEGRKMLATYKAEKVLLMAAHCLRFWPEYIYLAETVQNKNLGALKSLFLSRLVAYPFYSTESWLLDEKKSKIFPLLMGIPGK